MWGPRSGSKALSIFHAAASLRVGRGEALSGSPGGTLTTRSVWDRAMPGGKLLGPVSHLARLLLLFILLFLSLVFHVSQSCSAFKLLFFWDRQIPASLLESHGLAFKHQF